MEEPIRSGGAIGIQSTIRVNIIRGAIRKLIQVHWSLFTSDFFRVTHWRSKSGVEEPCRGAIGLHPIYTDLKSWLKELLRNTIRRSENLDDVNLFQFISGSLAEFQSEKFKKLLAMRQRP